MLNSSNWASLDDDDQRAMVNTNMAITCPIGTNCSSLKTTPGANIVSPVSMFLTGTIGNAVALLVLHRNSRREQMRTVFYLLVGSLVWTDLIGIILTSIPVLVVYTNGHWVGSTGLCNYHAFTMICIGLITPCIVCTMAIERFLGIRHTYFYKRHVNRHRLRLILLAQWIAVLIFTSLPFFGFGQYSRQYPGTWCFFDLHASRFVHIAYAFSFAIFIIILIVIIIVCNVAVIATLIGMRHRRKHLSSPTRDGHIHHNSRQREIEIQMVILLVGITLLFTTCWMPLMIQIILNQIVDYKNNHRRDLVAIRLVSINQTFDPWIYILFRKVIFTKFWRFLHRIFTGKRQSIKPKIKIYEVADVDDDHPRPLPQIHDSPMMPVPLEAEVVTQLPEMTSSSGNGATNYCPKCESQYGDDINSSEWISNGHQRSNCYDNDDDDDKDSALETEGPNSSSAGDGSCSSPPTLTPTSNPYTVVNINGRGRCQNCRQLIEKVDNFDDRREKTWKSRRRPTETLLSVKFLKKHSTKKSLPTASEFSSVDDCRAVQSDII